jgi:hypothetical protein
MSVAASACGSCDLNKGGLAMMIFERQVVALLHVGILDPDANKFQSSS